MGDEHRPWRHELDDGMVERLILAMQRATAAAIGVGEDARGDTTVPAPELATALLNLLASVLEPAPQCRTPSDMRKVSEAAGKELLVLMRGVRDLKTRPA